MLSGMSVLRFLNNDRNLACAVLWEVFRERKSISNANQIWTQNIHSNSWVYLIKVVGQIAAHFPKEITLCPYNEHHFMSLLTACWTVHFHIHRSARSKTEMGILICTPVLGIVVEIKVYLWVSAQPCYLQLL